ncbi:MAG: DUF3750 domain-containing protein [Hyphomicrobiales bacterium]|nr:DUF3750 domain-containing protein [Hyphomicrobiales bacterium]
MSPTGQDNAAICGRLACIDLRRGRIRVRPLRKLLLAIVLFFLVPIGAQAVIWSMAERPQNWRSADWSSAGLLPPAAEKHEAYVGVFTARTGRWKGIFAVHSWVVVKRQGAAHYDRYDVVGWGRPVRRNAYPPDGRWYSNPPQALREIEGLKAAALIPKVEAVIAAYPYAARGDYRVWPGPNSNTFVASILAAVPEIGTVLPPTAIGKDFPLDGSVFAFMPSGGLRLNFGGVLGITAGWMEGFEVNLLGGVAGLELTRPGLKLPGLGRIGI